MIQRLVRRWSLSRASIATRLLLASLLLVLLALPLAGAALSYHVRTTVTASFDEHLESLLNVVLASIQYDELEQRLTYERALGDPRFEQVFSGWYWQISDGAANVITSRSLWDQRLPVTHNNGVTVRNALGPRGTPVRIIERDIRLAALPAPLHVSVAMSREELDTEMQRFERLLHLTLLGLGSLLLLALAVQIRWGLAPLRRMHANLRDVESARAERLETALPDELSRLASAMNDVLARDQRLIERSRHTAGNLAHALKTPLSVLRLHVRQLPPDTRERFNNELTRIDEAVRHHLARASAAGDSGWQGTVNVADTLAPLLDGLSRLASRRDLILESTVSPTLSLHMDAQDLQELAGNLLDNALRWARHHVTFSVHQQDDRIHLTVSDDGPGMQAEQRQAALARGARLDEQRSGSGLGLAIVSDLLALYGGKLVLDRAPSGGLLANAVLPARPGDSRRPRT